MTHTNNCRRSNISRQVAYSMDKTNDGGYILCAYSMSFYGLWIIKTDFNGDTLWTKKYPVGKGYCIKRTDDAGYVVTGHRINGRYSAYLIKIDSIGETLWAREYNNSKDDCGNSVQQTSDGGYIIAGITEFPEPRNLDMWIIKTNSQGDTIWTKTYGGDYTDMPHSICETEDGGYFIAGEYAEEGELGLQAHIWLLKTDSNGDTLWTKKITNGSVGDYAYSMQKTSEGGYIIAGETVYDSFDSDIYLIKLSKEGNYQWFSMIGSNLGEIGDEKRYRGKDVKETTDGGYIITGFKWITMGWDKYMDICLLKVNDKGQITGLKKKKTKNSMFGGLQQNYPNPFNPTTQIQFHIAEKGHVRLTIYDILGGEVITLVNSKKDPGTHTVTWRGENKYGTIVSSGIYLYQLQFGLLSQNKKMIFLK